MSLILKNGIYEIHYGYDEAIEKGLKQYTGRPCRHGHGTLRFIANKDCVECRRISKNNLRAKYVARIALKSPKPKPKSYTPLGLTDQEHWAYRSVRIPSRKALQAEDIFTLLVDECPILEIPLQYSVPKNSKVIPDNYATLDKINPSKGYVMGNIQILSKKANTMKNNATIEELQKFAKNISKLWI